MDTWENLLFSVFYYPSLLTPDMFFFFFFFFQTKQFFQFSADTNWVSPVLTLFGVRKDSTREGLSTIMRQVVDAHPLLQGKILGDPFSVDQNSKTRIAEQLREEAGSYPDHIFLLCQARRLPQPHMHRKSPWRSKGSDAKGCSTHMPFW